MSPYIPIKFNEYLLGTAFEKMEKNTLFESKRFRETMSIDDNIKMFPGLFYCKNKDDEYFGILTSLEATYINLCMELLRNKHTKRYQVNIDTPRNYNTTKKYY